MAMTVDSVSSRIFPTHTVTKPEILPTRISNAFGIIAM